MFGEQPRQCVAALLLGKGAVFKTDKPAFWSTVPAHFYLLVFPPQREAAVWTPRMFSASPAPFFFRSTGELLTLLAPYMAAPFSHAFNGSLLMCPVLALLFLTWTWCSSWDGFITCSLTNKWPGTLILSKHQKETSKCFNCGVGWDVQR